MSKPKKVVSPEQMEVLQLGRKLWWDSLTPAEKTAVKEKAAATRQRNKIRKLKKQLKETEKVKTEGTLTDELKNLLVRLEKENVVPSIGDTREEVSSFSYQMEMKLRKRDGYGGWKSLPLSYVREKLKNELNELLVALDYETAPEVMSECVDVANYAMFLWDIMRAEDPRKDAALVGRTKDQGRS